MEQRAFEESAVYKKILVRLVLFGKFRSPDKSSDAYNVGVCLCCNEVFGNIFSTQAGDALFYVSGRQDMENILGVVDKPELNICTGKSYPNKFTYNLSVFYIV